MDSELIDTELEQVSHFLDEALIAFSAGQGDQGCRHLQEAATVLNTLAVPADAVVPAQTEERKLPELDSELAMAAAA